MENAAFWERMYAANINRMIGLCHRYVNDLALAEDLAHEAFLKAMERADTCRATGNFQAWLMRIIVFLVLAFSTIGGLLAQSTFRNASNSGCHIR